MAQAGERLLVLDAGTTSTRAMAFLPDGRIEAVEQADLAQNYPRPGWVEHDAAQIWERTLACARAVLDRIGGPSQVCAIGIANQRETVVAWDRESGEPLAPAIVWQDRRTAAMCDALREAGHERRIQQKTGLLLDAYFSATKMRWLLDNVSAVRRAHEAGRLAFGTVESWLLFKLTGGAHLSDAANASRTLLLPLAGASWDEGLCDLFGVPLSALPEVIDNTGSIATTRADVLGAELPVCGMAGDQQAATVGQGCLEPGDTKATFGTGAFVLTNRGRAVPLSSNRLVGTILFQQGGKRTYALEGSVFTAGSLISWLRDGLGLIESARDMEPLARSVEDTGGVVIVPALAGLGAPHWRPKARASISGLSYASTKAHIARAALEAMALQTHDLATAFAADGARWNALRIDGGMSANDWMAQDMADILDLPVERPAFVETTALGAAMLAGVGSGLFADLAEAVCAMRGPVSTFEPAMAEGVRAARIERWSRALEKV